ncbi:GNAT family N-acetyltransferase [Luedemannella helvata]|uniref:N-acetyltransferase domain-containing protein n=1 Tax=Luedemannella helvata TaxID=349315 RepID=A0ABN2L8E0_9ACTN
MRLTLRRADAEDFDTVMALLADSIAWLRGQGLDQWSTADAWPAKIRRSLDCGDVWLLNDDRPIGTITVETSGDPDFWTAAERSEPALYVSKLAVSRDRAGHELGGLLLEWSRAHAHALGSTWVRLDAWKSNPRLHRYYLDRGWKYVRTCDNPRRRSGTLFQLPAQPLGPEPRRRLHEMPHATVLPTSYISIDFDPATNHQPRHHHRAPGIVVDYPGAGRFTALLLADARYRLRHDGTAWILEGDQGGARWEHNGAVVNESIGLDPAVVYVLSHCDLPQGGEEPCGVVIRVQPADYS